MSNIIEFGEIPQGDDRPLPLIVADKWQFPLAWHVTDTEVMFSVHDWIKGLSGVDDARFMWRDVKNKWPNQLLGSISQLPYKAQNGKIYHMDFSSDVGLYFIAQQMRVTHERPVLSDIKQYLAKAGAFVDAARINPEEAEAAIAAARTKKYQQLGKEDEWIQLRNFSIFTRKQFTAYIQQLLGGKPPFGLITEDVYKGVFNKGTKGLRSALGIGPTATPRDHMGVLQLAYIIAAEEGCKIALQDYEDDEVLPLDTVRNVIQMIAGRVGMQAEEMANMLHIDLVTGKKLLPDGDNPA